MFIKGIDFYTSNRDTRTIIDPLYLSLSRRICLSWGLTYTWRIHHISVSLGWSVLTCNMRGKKKMINIDVSDEGDKFLKNIVRDYIMLLTDELMFANVNHRYTVSQNKSWMLINKLAIPSSLFTTIFISDQLIKVLSELLKLIKCTRLFTI